MAILCYISTDNRWNSGEAVNSENEHLFRRDLPMNAFQSTKSF